MTWETTCALEDLSETFTARHLLDRADASLSADRLDDARLIVTELVTNAVLHGTPGATVRLVVRWDGHSLRLEVRSEGPFRRNPGRDGLQGPYQEGGWGLQIVEALADRWGIESRTETIVW